MSSGGKDFFQVKMLRDRTIISKNGPTIFKKRGDVMITEMTKKSKLLQRENVKKLQNVLRGNA